jgi:hypothetical protein
MSQLSHCSEGKLSWFDEDSIPALCWIGHPVPAIILPIAFCLLFVLSKYVQCQDRQHQSRQPEKYQEHDHEPVRLRSQLCRGNMLMTHLTTAKRQQEPRIRATAYRSLHDSVLRLVPDY